MAALRLDGILLRPLLSLFSAAILCGLMLLFGVEGTGVIGVGVLYAFITYLGRLNEPLITLTSQQSVLQQAVISGERVFELMDSPQQKYGADDQPLTGGSIRVSHLTFAYQPENRCCVISVSMWRSTVLSPLSGIPAAGKAHWQTC